MSLNLEQKKVIVGEIAEVAGSAPSAVAAEYIGLSVAEMTDLRQKAREAGANLPSLTTWGWKNRSKQPLVKQ